MEPFSDGMLNITSLIKQW